MKDEAPLTRVRVQVIKKERKVLRKMYISKGIVKTSLPNLYFQKPNNFERSRNEKIPPKVLSRVIDKNAELGYSSVRCMVVLPPKGMTPVMPSFLPGIWND